MAAFVSTATFAKRFGARFKNISFDFTWDANVVRKGWKKAFREQKWKDVRGGMMKAVTSGMEKCSKLIYKLYKQRLKGSNPIMPMLLNVIKSIGEYMVSNPSKFIKISDPVDAGDHLMIEVEVNPFSLTMFEERSQKLRSLYYRRSGYVYGSYADYKDGKKIKRGKKIEKLLDERYDAKKPGLGWLVEFGREKSGQILPKQGKILLIWNEEKKGFFVSRKSRFSKAKGVHVIGTQKNVLRTTLRQQFRQIIEAELGKEFGGKK